MAMMTKTTTRLTIAVETYLADLQRVRASGGATGERSSYGPLANLLNAIGATLKPNVLDPCCGTGAFWRKCYAALPPIWKIKAWVR